MKKSSRQKCLDAFQKLRRLQEADENGYVQCISSHRWYKWNQVDGGHYISRGCHATELEPDNVFPQSKRDNMYLSGNSAEYRVRLITKIGIERVERLENMSAAYAGSDIAYNKLSSKDKIKIVQRKTSNEYEILAKCFRGDCRRIERELSI